MLNIIVQLFLTFADVIGENQELIFLFNSIDGACSSANYCELLQAFTRCQGTLYLTLQASNRRQLLKLFLVQASKKQSTPLRGWNRTSSDPHQALVGYQPHALQPHHPHQLPTNYSYSPQPNYSPQNHAHAANYPMPQQMPPQYQTNPPNYPPSPNYDQVPSVEQRNVVNAAPMVAQLEPHPTAGRNLQSAELKKGMCDF